MGVYVTTNIRISEEDYLRLKADAARKRTSLSAIIREKVSNKLPPENYAEKLLTLKTNWFSYKEYKKNKTRIKRRMKRYEW